MQDLHTKIINIIKKRHGAAHFKDFLNSINADRNDIILALLELEYQGKIKRKEADRYIPFTSATWVLADDQGLSSTKEKCVYSIVISLPQNLPPNARNILEQTIHGGASQIPLLKYDEAYQAVFKHAQNELLISSPFIDQILLYYLNETQARKILLLTDDVRNVLVKKISKTLPHVKIRTLAQYSGGNKMLGVHAKLVIADKETVLLGSANISSVHLVYDLDIGILFHCRKLAEELSRIFYLLWDNADPIPSH